jgi:hypothetical protein
MQSFFLRRREFSILIIGLAVSVTNTRAADPAEYKPKGDFYSMEAHFRWCDEAPNAATKVKRYEKFWELQAPEESDGYDDSLHVRTVRRCAYRLAQLYAQLGRPKDCLKLLQWLEKEDDSLKVNAE